jgi:hypothetical protein
MKGKITWKEFLVADVKRGTFNPPHPCPDREELSDEFWSSELSPFSLSNPGEMTLEDIR